MRRVPIALHSIIKDRRLKGDKVIDLARDYNVSDTTIYEILNGGKYSRTGNAKDRLTIETAYIIRQRLLDREPKCLLSAEYNVSNTTLYNIEYCKGRWAILGGDLK